MGNEISVREATPLDLESICGLFFQLFNQQHEAHPDVFRQPAMEDVDERKRLADYIVETLEKDDQGIMVATKSDAVVGVVHLVLRSIDESPTVPFRHAHREAWVQHIVVASAHRGTGIGRTLDDAVRLWARERHATCAAMQVWAYNVDAQASFEKLGYKTQACRLTVDFGATA